MRNALALLFALLTTPAFAGCGSACYMNGGPGGIGDENQLYLGAWKNLLVRDLVGGTLTDQVTGNAQWITTSAPAITPNADGLGYSAWTFDGSTANNIQASFAGPNGGQMWPVTGEFSLALEATLSASLPSSGTTTYALAGSGLTSVNGWVLGIKRQSGSNYAFVFCYTGQTTCTVMSGTISTGTPHAVVFSWSSVDQIAGVSVDGGAFQTTSTALQTATSTDATLWIGSSASSSYSPWFGNIFRAMYLNESLQNSAKAAQFAYLTAILSAKY